MSHEATYFQCSPSFDEWLHKAMEEECERRARIFESEEGYDPYLEAVVEYVPIELLPEVQGISEL